MLTLKAHAKINLTLKILGLRPDGFHDIESTMQAISLCDIVTIKELPSGIEVSCDDPSVPLGKANLVYKAAELFLKKFKINKGVEISIEKNIPVAAGLAGGSADAAAVLFGLNELWKTNAELWKLASEVGADVAFSLSGGTSRCTGKGEYVEKVDPIPRTWMVLVKPDVKILSEWSYQTYDLEVGYAEEREKAEVQKLYDLGLFNDLEKVAIKHHPDVLEIKKWLIQEGSVAALMSGSGPTVVGFAADQKTARTIFDKARLKYNSVYFAVTVPHGVEVLGAEEWVPEIEA